MESVGSSSESIITWFIDGALGRDRGGLDGVGNGVSRVSLPDGFKLCLTLMSHLVICSSKLQRSCETQSIRCSTPFSKAPLAAHSSLVSLHRFVSFHHLE